MMNGSQAQAVEAAVDRGRENFANKPIRSLVGLGGGDNISVR